MAFLIQNTRTDDFIDDNGDWTVIRSFAKRFSTKQEAEQFIAKNQVKGDDPYMKVVKEMKGLKEFVKVKSLKEDKVFVIHTKGGKVDYIEKGEYFAGPHGKMFVRDANVDLKDWKGMDPKDAKEALIHFTRIDPKSIIIEGCKKVQEAKVNDRIFPDAGEVQVVSKTGAFGIQVFIDTRERSDTPDGKRKIHWNISTAYEGPYNSEANKNLFVDENENLEKLVKDHANEFKAVIKRGIERIDDDIAATLKKLGYK